MGRPPQCHCHCVEPSSSSSSAGLSSSAGGLSSSSSSSSSSGLVHGCAGCVSGISRCWELTVAGVTNSLCTLCANLNGTFILKSGFNNLGSNPSHDPCNFTQIEPAISYRRRNVGLGICESFAKGVWYLGPPTGGSGNVRELDFMEADTASRMVVYGSGATFNCNSPNVMTRSGSGNTGCTYPLTLTLVPIACP